MSARRPLQNRVAPTGELVAIEARGMLMGNRGGRFHRADKTLGARRWASKQWIACLCAFKGRRREVWGAGYTEVFFFDEVTALAAGHRPCFECRRRQAQAFARAMNADGPALSAPAMDALLHQQRRQGRGAELDAPAIDALPDGAVIASGHGLFALRGNSALPWRFVGYGPALARSQLTRAQLVTPPAVIAALRAGYAPLWGPFAS